MRRGITDITAIVVQRLGTTYLRQKLMLMESGPQHVYAILLVSTELHRESTAQSKTNKDWTLKQFQLLKVAVTG